MPKKKLFYCAFTNIKEPKLKTYKNDVLLCFYHIKKNIIQID